MNYQNLCVLEISRWLEDYNTQALRSYNGMTLIRNVHLISVAHGIYLGVYGKPLIKEPIEFTENGISIRKLLYKRLHDYESAQLPESIETFLSKVYNMFSNLNDFELTYVVNNYFSTFDYMSRNIDTRKTYETISDEVIQERFEDLIQRCSVFETFREMVANGKD